MDTREQIQTVEESAYEMERIAEQYEGERNEYYNVELTGQEIAVLINSLVDTLEHTVSSAEDLLENDSEFVAESQVGTARLLNRSYSKLTRRLDVEDRDENC